VFIEFSFAEVETFYGAHLHRVFDPLKVRTHREVEQGWLRTMRKCNRCRAELLAELVCPDEWFHPRLAESHR
jgi:hypothetical protein